MRYLVTGLGSMGKRRLRCFKALGVTASDLAGFDLREDRRREAANLSGARTFDDFDQALAEHVPDAVVISTPPGAHLPYMRRCVEARIPFFTEASVLDDGLEEIEKQCAAAGIVAAPSSTLCFHPGFQLVFDAVDSGRLGRISSVLYHSGQYLPDWHVYEPVSAFYVSNPATGGAREIVPFELGWITRLFGFPVGVRGHCRKTIDIPGAETIDDTYHALLDYGSLVVNLTVDVVSRYATRRMLINGEKGQLRWDWGEKRLEIYDGDAKAWTRLDYDSGQAHKGYEASIGELMYIRELDAFIGAVAGGPAFPNTLSEDRKVLKTLYAIEASEKSGQATLLPFAGRG